MKNSIKRIISLTTALLMLISMIAYAGDRDDPMDTNYADKNLSVDVVHELSLEKEAYVGDEDVDIEFTISHNGTGDHQGLGENKDLLLAVKDGNRLIYNYPSLDHSEINKVHLTTDAALVITFNDLFSQITVTPGERKVLDYEVFDYGKFHGGNGPWEHTEVYKGQIILEIAPNSYTIELGANPYELLEGNAGFSDTFLSPVAGSVSFLLDGVEIHEADGNTSPYFVTVEEGKTIKFLAEPSTGFKFVEWRYNLKEGLVEGDPLYRPNPRVDFLVDGSDLREYPTPVFMKLKETTITFDPNGGTIDDVSSVVQSGYPANNEAATAPDISHPDPRMTNSFLGWAYEGELYNEGDLILFPASGEGTAVAQWGDKVNLWIATDDSAEVYFNGVDAEKVNVNHSGAWKDSKEYFIDVDDNPLIAIKAKDGTGVANIAGTRLAFLNEIGSFINTNSTWWVFVGGNDNTTIATPAPWVNNGTTYDWNDPEYVGTGWVNATELPDYGTWATASDFPSDSNTKWVWSSNYDYEDNEGVRIDTPVFLRSEKPGTITFTVSYDSRGGSTVDSEPVNDGEKATEPTEPTKGLDTFIAWYEDLGDGNLAAAAFDFDTTINKNVTLVARWDAYVEPEAEVYTVSYDSMGGSTVASELVNDGEKATEPTEPTKGLDTFIAWYEDLGDGNLATAAFDFDTIINRHVTLVAQWDAYVEPEAEVYTVSYDSVGGSIVASELVNDGEKATEPVDPTKGLDTFIAWYEVIGDGVMATEAFDFDTVITANTVLVAKWQTYVPDTYVVVFNADGGTPTPEVENVAEGGSATRPEIDPLKANANFIGWYEDFGEDGVAEAPYVFDTELEGNVTLIALYEDVTPVTTRTRTITYTLSVVIEGEGSVVGAGNYKPGRTATLVATPADGYAFDRWSGDTEDGTVEMNNNKRVTAIFVEDLGEEVETILPEAPGAGFEDDILDVTPPEAAGDGIEDQPLPQTGGFPMAVYTGLGLLVSGFGYKLRKRK